MSLTQNDEVIETLTPDRSDQLLCKAILPRRRRRYRLVPDTHGTNAALGEFTVDAIVIPDEMAWHLIPGERLGELACNPICCRIWRHVNPDQLSTAQPDDDEGIEQPEPDGRDYEQIHGCDIRGMVPQEGAPSLTRRFPSLDHVFGYRQLCDLKAELEQFTMDARCTPNRVLDAHSPDQSAQLRPDLRPPSSRTRFPTPVGSKAGTMPTNDRLRLNDGKDPQDRRKAAVKLDQKQAIEVREINPAARLTP